MNVLQGIVLLLLGASLILLFAAIAGAVRGGEG